MRTLRRVGVLGAGGRPSPSYARPPPPPPPPAPPAPAMALVKPGNFDDNLDEIAECDWIIEAVTENLEIKRGLWKKVEPLRKPEAILSTNTSGIPLAKISEGFSPEFRRHFLGTHFFNPPRYLHLVEVIPGAETDPEVLAFVSDFATAGWAKASCPARTRRTSSPIASAVSSAAPCRRSRSKTTTPSKRWTRSPAR